jgi:hypothetical protein
VEDNYCELAQVSPPVKPRFCTFPIKPHPKEYLVTAEIDKAGREVMTGDKIEQVREAIAEAVRLSGGVVDRYVARVALGVVRDHLAMLGESGSSAYDPAIDEIDSILALRRDAA